ncbi:unnamed protein product [Timema podura]|uniref:Uncharacterized protein n=1 Tax=Timema podura TaxID=61482 RepID=A0ABN7PEU5_TIMPD|nr:unnamed protein product [Timema podura]
MLQFLTLTAFVSVILKQAKTTLSTADWNSNPNFSVIGSLVYCEKYALDQVVTKLGHLVLMDVTAKREGNI